MDNKHLIQSPCEDCRKADGETCENKTCGQWRKWFNDRWNYTCGALAAQTRGM